MVFRHKSYSVDVASVSDLVWSGRNKKRQLKFKLILVTL